MKKLIKLLLILLVIAAVFAASYFGVRLGLLNEASRAAADDEQLLNANESIVLAGYDTIKFDAQQTEQQIYFCNSDKNKCFIVVSLLVDNAELYTSEMLAPNTKIESITLSEPLSKGVYDAVIRYSCYDLYTQRELNGSEIAVKLEVD